MLEAISDSLTDSKLRLPLLGLLTGCSEQRLTTCTYIEIVFLPRSEAQTQPPRYNIHLCMYDESMQNHDSCFVIARESRQVA